MRIEDLSLWEAFHSVAKERSFTKAAAAMRVGTPVLSKKVARLEEQLGVRLFQRSTRTVGLTEEGRSLLPHVDSLLNDAQALVARFEDKNRLQGTIRITCPTSVGHRLMAPVLIDFRHAHPDVRFEIDLNDKVVDLISAQVDLAIRASRDPADSEHVWWRLCPNRLIFCASPEYLKANPKPLRKPDDLKFHHVVSAKVFENFQLQNSTLRVRDLSASRVISANSGMFLTELALKGGGIAVRSVWDVHEHLKSGRLVQVLAKYSPEDYGSIYAVTPSRRHLSPRLRAFIDFLVKRAKSWDS